MGITDELFNKWASTYNEQVQMSEREKTYPFAGYMSVIGYIIEDIIAKGHKNVLDLGCGTGKLSKELYGRNIDVTAVDFSEEMLKIARIDMKDARIIHSDILDSLIVLEDELFESIILTYSIHHYEPSVQIALLRKLHKKLTKKGNIYIGDVMFENFKNQEEVKGKQGLSWDEEEFYIEFDHYVNELSDSFDLEYIKKSFCSGVIKLSKK